MDEEYTSSDVKKKPIGLKGHLKNKRIKTISFQVK